MKFTTETGSVYEVDIKRKKLRRTHGTHPPVEGQENDGAWFDYVWMMRDPIPGFSTTYFWKDPLGELKQTTTSRVINVI